MCPSNFPLTQILGSTYPCLALCSASVSLRCGSSTDHYPLSRLERLSSLQRWDIYTLARLSIFAGYGNVRNCARLLRSQMDLMCRWYRYDIGCEVFAKLPSVTLGYNTHIIWLHQTPGDFPYYPTTKSHHFKSSSLLFWLWQISGIEKYTCSNPDF